jgi:hypothetical protein
VDLQALIGLDGAGLDGTWDGVGLVNMCIEYASRSS